MLTLRINFNYHRYFALILGLHLLCGLFNQSVAQTGSGFSIEQQLDQLRQMVLNHERKLSVQQQQIQSLQGDNAVLERQVVQLKLQYQQLLAKVNRKRIDVPAVPPLDTVPIYIEERANPHPTTSSDATTLPSNTQPVNLTAKTEKGIYQQAYKLVETQQFAEAISAMQQVIERYPQGRYADNAQYWIGEAQYALRRYQAALAAFNTLLADYPQSRKRPHALLKIGYCYYELKDYAAARAVLKQVQKLYPQTPTAHLAEQRMQRMQTEGV